MANNNSKHKFLIFTNKGDFSTWKANSKRGLIGILKCIIDNNLYDISQDPITIWGFKVFEKQSGIKSPIKKEVKHGNNRSDRS